MKKDSSEFNLAAVEDALRQAYRRKVAPPVDQHWESRVMRSIRLRGPLQKKNGFLEAFGRFAWKLAPVCCVLIIFFAACTFYLDLVPEHELTRSYVNNPMEFIVLEELGI